MTKILYLKNKLQSKGNSFFPKVETLLLLLILHRKHSNTAVICSSIKSQRRYEVEGSLISL